VDSVQVDDVRLVRRVPRGDRRVPRALDPAAGVLAVLALLGVLSSTVTLNPSAWAAGLVWGLGTNAALAGSLVRSGATRMGPANVVTLTRATLVAGVAAVVADSFVGPTPVVALVVLSTVALVLDAVDGRVARRTGTVTPLGARFDMEVDAFLILVLSVHVARSAGAWVLLLGAARYAYGAAGRAWPWLRGSLPARPWRKVVTAAVGIVLAVVSSELLPATVATLALVVATGLLAESFGRDVRTLARRRLRQRAGSGPDPAPAPA
jgi:phosphatidylglycerophosphate synthase